MCLPKGAPSLEPVWQPLAHSVRPDDAVVIEKPAHHVLGTGRVHAPVVGIDLDLIGRKILDKRVIVFEALLGCAGLTAAVSEGGASELRQPQQRIERYSPACARQVAGGFVDLFSLGTQLQAAEH